MNAENDRTGDEGLAALAAEIKRHHAAGEEATHKGLEHFQAAGALLLESHARCKKEGRKWLKWLEEEVEISQPTAWRYMRLAKNWQKLFTMNNRPVSLQAALRLLGQDAPVGRKRRGPKPQPASAPAADRADPAARQPRPVRWELHLDAGAYLEAQQIVRDLGAHWGTGTEGTVLACLRQAHQQLKGSAKPRKKGKGTAGAEAA